MAIENTGINNQQTRDEIGSEPKIQSIYKIKGEDVLTEEASTQVNHNSLGNAWIVGTTTNAIVGVNTGTEGGGQQVVGGNGRVVTLQEIINPNNIYRERFNYANFNDTGMTTADWLSNGSLSFTSSEIAQSSPVAKNGSTWSNATLLVTLSSGVIGDLTLQMSADGGSNFETVTNSTEHLFTNTGSELKWKITASGTVVVSSVIISYA